MATFTSSLPDKTLAQLASIAHRLDVPKNQLVNQALIKYFFEMERQQYIDSFKQIANDDEMLGMADMGLGDYLDQLTDLDENP